jgi:hypothetical protein
VGWAAAMQEAAMREKSSFRIISKNHRISGKAAAQVLGENLVNGVILVTSKIATELQDGL